MYYNENDKCEKCGKTLKSEIIKYGYSHDGGIYDESYKKVDRGFAKEVGLNFYCNDCYENIGNSKIDEIINKAIGFINKDLVDAKTDVENHYKLKIQQLTDIENYMKNCITFLKSKELLSDLSKEELNMLSERNYIYQPNHQSIKIGFCAFEEYSEVRELYNKKEIKHEKV